MAYAGPASRALDHFKSLGHACPQYYNPAEFFIDLVAVDTDAGPLAEAEDRRRVDEIVEAWAKTPAALEMAAEAEQRAGPSPPVVSREGEEAAAAAAASEESRQKTQKQRANKEEAEPAEETKGHEGRRGDVQKRRGRFGGGRKGGRGSPGALKQFRLLVGRAWKQTRREAWVNGVRLAASAAGVWDLGFLWFFFLLRHWRWRWRWCWCWCWCRGWFLGGRLGRETAAMERAYNPF